MDHKIFSACLDDLEFVLNLNQRNTPAVSNSSFEIMSYFLKVSEYFKILTVDEKPIGFLIALMPDKDYHSQNYRWFNNKYNSFIYIDRIVISEEYQRRGYGKLFYSELHHFSKGRVSKLACEVNTRPIHQQSIKFHDRFGFYEVGTQETENGKKKVSLLMFDTKSG